VAVTVTCTGNDSKICIFTDVIGASELEGEAIVGGLLAVSGISSPWGAQDAKNNNNKQENTQEKNRCLATSIYTPI
jgi:hypothetical protein